VLYEQGRLWGVAQDAETRAGWAVHFMSLKGLASVTLRGVPVAGRQKFVHATHGVVEAPAQAAT
jgi:hypothetical protein